MSEEETLPEEAENEASNLVSTTSILATEQDLDAALARADIQVRFMEKAKAIALKVTNARDWHRMGENPYLSEIGCQKVSGVFGISFRDIKSSKEQMKDDRGEYIVFECTGIAMFNGRDLPVDGSSSTRDDFFAKRTNKETQEPYLLPLSEIPYSNVKKKALTNMYHRGIVKILGLNPTWEEVEAATGGKAPAGGSVGYGKNQTTGSGGALSPEKKKIRDLMAEIFSDDMSKGTQWLISETEFTTGDGKQVRGKSEVKFLTDKQAPHVLKKIEALWKEQSGNFGENPPTDDEMLNAFDGGQQ